MQDKSTIFTRKPRRRYFDFDKLREVTKLATRNLNKIIDVNYYPVDTAKRSNMRHRPIGLGVQVTCTPSHTMPALLISSLNCNAS